MESIAHGRKSMIAARPCCVVFREPPHRATILTIREPQSSERGALRNRIGFMFLRRVMVLFLIPAAPLLAQLANNTVTVTASQSSIVQPDVAVFSVAVTAGTIMTLDEVVGALSGLGVIPANLVSVGWRPVGCFALTSAPRCPPSNLQWTFQLTVPVTKLKDTMAALTSLQKSISQNNSWLTEIGKPLVRPVRPEKV